MDFSVFWVLSLQVKPSGKSENLASFYSWYHYEIPADLKLLIGLWRSLLLA